MYRSVRFACSSILTAAIAAAQTISGDLVVNVVDASGAVVANSKLALTEVATNVKLESVTDTLLF